MKIETEEPWELLARAVEIIDRSPDTDSFVEAAKKLRESE